MKRKPVSQVFRIFPEFSKFFLSDQFEHYEVSKYLFDQSYKRMQISATKKTSVSYRNPNVSKHLEVIHLRKWI